MQVVRLVPPALGVGLGVAAGIIAIGAIDVNNTEDDNVVSAR